MNRRGFLASILAAAAAPAIVRADSLMRIVPRETLLVDVPLGHYSEQIVIHQLRAPAAGLIGNLQGVQAELNAYFSARLDALMADALKEHLLTGVPLVVNDIEKGLHG